MGGGNIRFSFVGGGGARPSLVRGNKSRGVMRHVGPLQPSGDGGRGRGRGVGPGGSLKHPFQITLRRGCNK